MSVSVSRAESLTDAGGAEPALANKDTGPLAYPEGNGNRRSGRRTLIIRALGSFPDGVTTALLAERLHMNANTLGSQLSKAFMYGLIDRRATRGTCGGREMVWRVK